MTRRLLVLALCSWVWLRSADIIPSNVRPGFVPGTDTGVPGGIPTNNDIYTTITPTGDTTDRTADINSAIANAGSAGKVVLLAAGTYYIDGTINFYSGATPYSNRILRGAGVGQTTLIFTHATATGVMLGMSAASAPGEGIEAITVSADRGETTVTIGGGTDLAQGDLIGIYQDNVDTEVINDQVEIHVEYPAIPVRQMFARVTTVAGNEVTFSPGLYFQVDATKNAKVRQWYYGINNEGTALEDMTLSFPNKTGLTCVMVYSTYGSWIKNVKLEPYAANQGIWLYETLRMEIRHSEIAASTNNGGSNREGLKLDYSGGWLIEDNILRKASPHVEINFSSSGGSFSYNYCENTNVLDTVMGASINANHGPHPHSNLYEGNYTNKFQADGYFGSTSDCFLVRNVLHGTNELGDGDADTDLAVALNLNRFTRSYYVVGNIIGVPQSWWTAKAGYTMEYNPTGGIGANTPAIYAFGYPNIGGFGFTGTASAINDDLWADYRTADGPSGYQELDQDVQATTIFKGNWNGVDSGIATGEALGGDTVSSSYAYASKPSWFGTLSWPPYDASTYTFTTLDADAVKIPAGWRAINENEDYLTGGGSSGGVQVTNLSVTTFNVP